MAKKWNLQVIEFTLKNSAYKADAYKQQRVHRRQLGQIYNGEETGRHLCVCYRRQGPNLVQGHGTRGETCDFLGQSVTRVCP